MLILVTQPGRDENWNALKVEKVEDTFSISKDLIIQQMDAEIPFVAYSFYTGQIENYSYFTIVVVDDYINNTILGELPEGTIQAYARKMVESVTIE